MISKPHTYLIFLIILLQGCIFGAKKDPLALKDHASAVTSKVFDDTRLKAGGRLLIIPFNAGPNVAANKELDRISLYIVKGITETFNESKSTFEILTMENAMSADLVIKGYINRLDRSKGVKRWFPGGRKSQLGIESWLTDQKTGNLVLRFYRQKINRKGKTDFESMAYQIGQELGEFILGHLE